jgi:hypothetical protein
MLNGLCLKYTVGTEVASGLVYSTEWLGSEYILDSYAGLVYGVSDRSGHSHNCCSNQRALKKNFIIIALLFGYR